MSCPPRESSRVPVADTRLRRRGAPRRGRRACAPRAPAAAPSRGLGGSRRCAGRSGCRGTGRRSRRPRRRRRRASSRGASSGRAARARRRRRGRAAPACRRPAPTPAAEPSSSSTGSACVQSSGPRSNTVWSTPTPSRNARWPPRWPPALMHARAGERERDAAPAPPAAAAGERRGVERERDAVDGRVHEPDAAHVGVDGLAVGPVAPAGQRGRPVGGDADADAGPARRGRSPRRRRGRASWRSSSCR